MNHKRSDRLAGVIRSVIGKEVVMVPPTIATGVCMTSVRVSEDLKYADIFVSAIEGADRAMKHLSSRTSAMRKELSKHISTYATPELRFRVDGRGEELSRLDALLASL